MREKQRFVPKLILSNGLAAITPLLWIVFIVNSMVLYFLQNGLSILMEGLGVDPRGAGLTTMMFSVGGALGGLCTLAFEYEETHDRLQRLAYFDALTTLPDRGMLERKARRILAEARRDGTRPPADMAAR